MIEKKGRSGMVKESKIRVAVEESFPAVLREVFGDNLLSVMLYGSYVSGDFVPGVSDVNVLVILQNSDTDSIGALGRKAPRMIRKFRITPLILTRGEFVHSADVFPMEYADIKDRNRVLMGDDEARSLTLEKRNLRHQLEEMLRGSVASLRQVLIASRGRRRILEANLKVLFGSLKALFKGLLRLQELEEIPSEGVRIVEEVSRNFRVDGEPFKGLLQLRSGERVDAHKLASETLASLEQLITVVDRMKFKE